MFSPSRKNPIEIGKILSESMIKDMMATHTQGNYGSVVSFALAGKPHLCEFSLKDFQPEFKARGLWYVSMGSGQSILDPVMALMRSIYWRGQQPTVQDAMFVVTWALQHTIDVNAGGVNGPIRMAVLEKNPQKPSTFGARFIDDDELQEHKAHMESAIERLREHAESQKSTSLPPDIPKPLT